MQTSTSKFSLRENVRLRILKEMIANLKEKFRSVSNFIMVIDPITTKIMSSTVKPIELIEEGVLVLERLELGRKSFHEAHAIYFVAPVEQSINFIIKDFMDPSDPQYGNIHLFFSNHVPPKLFEKLKKQKTLLERVLTFKEINIDFVSPEPNVFHLNLPEALPVIFSKQGQPETQILEEKIAARFAALIPNLGDFSTFQIIYNKNKQNSIAEKIATFVKEKAERFLKLKSEDDDDDDNIYPVKIVILDRSFDPLTPALLDYHYKSMLYEFLGVEGDVIEFDGQDKEGNPVKKIAVLNDKDDVWVRYKDQFISDAMMKISGEFDEFVRKNANAQMSKTPEASMDLSQMLLIAQQIPQYEELLEKYTLHMSLIEKVLEIFRDKELMEIGDLEQCLATSIDDKGKTIPNPKLIAMIAQKIAQGKLDSDTKTRLMIITSFAMELHERERKSLMQPLSGEGKDMLARLTWLGLKGSEGVVRRKSTRKINDSASSLKDKKGLPSTLCRHSPMIESLVEEIALNKVDRNKFSFLFVPNGPEFESSVKTNAKKNPVKIVFFVIGGITHAEVRAVLDYEKINSHVSVIAGGTSFLAVHDYMDGIRQMTPIKAHQEIDISNDD